MQNGRLRDGLDARKKLLFNKTGSFCGDRPRASACPPTPFDRLRVSGGGGLSAPMTEGDVGSRLHGNDVLCVMPALKWFPSTMLRVNSKLTMSESCDIGQARHHSSIRRDVSMKLVTSSGPLSVMSTASSMW